MGIIPKLSVGGILGLGLGILLNIWINPATMSGTLLLTGICVATGIACSSLVMALLGSKKDDEG